MRLRILPLVVLGATVLSGCEDALTVTNPNNPDVGRALSTPDGIEALFRTSFQQVHQSTHGTSNALWPSTQVVAGESYATVANFGMALRAGIPRSVIDNNLGNQTATENFRDFSFLQRNARNIANGIRALDNLVAAGGSIGTPTLDARARAFGWFSMAVALGNTSLVYDSLGVPSPSADPEEVPALVGAAEGMTAALAYLDSALAVANTPAGAGISYPSDWLRVENAPVSRARFIQIVRSYKARFRAGVARTPEQRAAVNWNEVVNDAAAGITTDLTLDLATAAGWTAPWLNQALVSSGWSSMTPLYIGMADTSGAYRAWVTSPIPQRTLFLIHTPDERFPSGATRAAQQADSPPTTAVLPETYFRARPPGDDTPGEAWGNSPYDFVRFQGYRQNNANGPWHIMTAAEIAMLRAEGLIRTNRAAEAMPLVNASRTENGLPAFTDPAGRAPQHPGGGAFTCVPQTPTGPGGSVQCGTLMEAMKYEKRLETMFTGYAQWFIDHRGWGDLVQGTALSWPVPYQEIQARYGAAGVIYNSNTAAAAGTYGF